MTILKNEKLIGCTSIGIHKKNAGLDSTTKETYSQIGFNYKEGSPVFNYKYLIDARSNASSYYRRVVTNVKQQGVIVGAGYHGPTQTSSEVWGYSNNSPLAVDQSDSIIRDIALKKLKGRLSRDVNDFNLLVPIGELTELNRTIGGTYRQIGSLLKALGSLRNLRVPRGDITKYAADVWLNFSFGINPMISDVNNLLDSIESFKKRKDSVKRYTGRHSKTWMSSGWYTPQLMVGTTARQYLRYYHTLSYKFIAAQDLRLISGNDYSIYNHLHLSPTEIIPVLWELLPWSWLVDYVTNTGEFLTDYFQSTPGNTIYCVECKKYVRHLTVDTERPTPNIYVKSWMHVPHRQVDTFFTRTPASSIPHRILRWRTPYELEQHSWKKLLNLIAVMRGRIRS